MGSSPRVRGKQRDFWPQNALTGLIPACAGKTVNLCPELQGAGAHPRVCGENLSSSGIESSGVGSSPRVRGKLDDRGDSSFDAGLIPACAGKTWSASAL